MHPTTWQSDLRHILAEEGTECNGYVWIENSRPMRRRTQREALYLFRVSLEERRLLVSPENVAQRVRDLTDRRVRLHTFDDERHRVYGRVRRAFAQTS